MITYDYMCNRLQLFHLGCNLVTIFFKFLKIAQSCTGLLEAVSYWDLDWALLKFGGSVEAHSKVSLPIYGGGDWFLVLVDKLYITACTTPEITLCVSKIVESRKLWQHIKSLCRCSILSISIDWWESQFSRNTEQEILLQSTYYHKEPPIQLFNFVWSYTVDIHEHPGRISYWWLLKSLCLHTICRLYGLHYRTPSSEKQLLSFLWEAAPFFTCFYTHCMC